MVKSWFTQMSSSLQLIHKSVVNCELEPESEERFKCRLFFFIMGRVLMSLLQGMATSWISREGFDTGIVKSVLNIVSTKPKKARKKLASIILPVLLTSASTFPDDLNALLFA